MSRIPIASLANGVLFATQTFASPSNPSGVPVLTPAVGAQCSVYIHDTSTPAAVWTDELGSTPLIAPLRTDATGTVPGWVDTSLLPLDLIVALPSGNVTFVLAGGGSGGGGGGAISSVFGRTGSITAQIGDYTASQVGADPAGAAGTVQAAVNAEVTRATAAEATNATAISAETTRARAAEGALIPLSQVGAVNGVASLTFAGAKATEAPGLYIPPGWGSFWKAKLALAQAGTGKATLAIVGDSITQGWRCSDVESTSFVALTRAYLQGKYGDGGSGYKSTQDSASSSLSSETALVAAWTAAGPDRMWATTGTTQLAGFPSGPSIEAVALKTAGGTATAVMRGTTIKLYIMTINSTTFGGVGTATVDGVSSQAISSQTANGMQVVTWTGLSPGQHTLVVTAGALTGSQVIYLCGASAENATGVVVNKYAHPGWASPSTNNVVAQTFNAYGNAFGNANSNLSAPAGAWSGGSKYPADCTVFAFGVNDAREGFSGDSWAQNMRRYLEDVQSGTGQQGTTDVVILLPHVGTLEASTANARTYQDIAGRAKAVAHAYGAAVVDVWRLGRNSYNYWQSLNFWGNATTPGASGTEIIHPSDAGHAFIASALEPVLG